MSPLVSASCTRYGRIALLLNLNERKSMTDVTTAVSTPVVLTKEERIAKLVAQIALLNTKIYNIENDIVVTKAVKKEAPLPEVGTDVLFNYGRRTATTEPVQKTGTVVAIKPACVVTNEAGVTKKQAAMIKLSVGTGFDQEFVVIYPASIVGAAPEEQEEAEQEIV